MSHQFQHEDHNNTTFGTIASGGRLITRDDMRDLWLYNPGSVSVTLTQSGLVLATLQPKGSMSVPWYFSSTDAPTASGALSHSPHG